MFILAVDSSTQTNKISLLNSDFQIIKEIRKEHKQYFSNQNWIEHDPIEILNNLLTLITQIIQQSNINPQHIKSLGITNQRETLVVWEKNTGKPLHNAIVWNDYRTKQLCEKYIQKYGSNNFFQKKNGLLIDSYFSLFKLIWLLENKQNIKQAYDNDNLLIGTIDTWLIYNITQNKNHFTDVSNASRTFLMNLQTLQWDDEILKEFNIKKNILPQIKHSSDNFGILNIDKLQHVQINGILGDQQAASLSMGLCSGDKKIKITLGSGIFMMISTGQQTQIENGLLTTVIYSDKEKVFYGMEGAIETGGIIIQFLQNQLKLNVWELDKQLQNNTQEIGQEIFIGSFGRVMAPYWKSNTGCKINYLNYNSNDLSIWKAFLQSICFRIKQCLEKVNYQDYQIVLDGGLSNNIYLVNFLGKLLNKEIYVMNIKDQTIKGAGLAAGIYQKVYQMEILNKILNDWQKIENKDQEDKQIQEKYKKFTQELEKDLKQIIQYKLILKL